MTPSTQTTEYRYNPDGQLEELIVRNSVTGDQVTTWHYGTTLSDSAIASKSLLRAKVYPDSDDLGAGDDGTDDVYNRVEVSYNRQREMVLVRDQNGTEHRFEYDGLGRLRQDRVTALGTGIDGAVRRITRQYDPTGRLERVSSWDQPAVGQGSAVNEVLLRYNGFGQLTREYQSHAGTVATGSTPSVQYAYADGTNRHIRKLSTTYPGGREIAFAYGSAGSADDKLGRVQEIKDATDENKVLARYTRRGISATMRIEYPHAGSSNPLEMTYIKQAGETNGPAGDQYTGQDRFNRIIDIRWLRSGTTSHVDRIQYGFDRAGNRLWRKNVVAATDWDELYAYDGLYQLPERQRGTLNSGNTGLTGTPLDQEEFLYDPAGNWGEYVTSASGSTTLDQTRTHNKANEIIAIDASSALVSHDAAGNMTKFPKVGSWSTAQTATWDAWNRLVKIEEGSTIIGQYGYDGLTRRVNKTSNEGSGSVVRYFYYSDQWQVLEERLGTSQLEDRTFVWGLRYIDDLILRDRGTERLYATHDQWHVISTVGTDGNATERYAYKAFGAMQVLAPNFSPRSTSVSGWETTYGAYRWDRESELYAVRFRYLHPGLGRWLSGDPVGESVGSNLFAAVDNTPANYIDVHGLFQWDKGTRTITVGKCEVTLIIGHAVRNEPITWKFTSLCSGGAAVTCFPLSNAPKPPAEGDDELWESGLDILENLDRWNPVLSQRDSINDGQVYFGNPPTAEWRMRKIQFGFANFFDEIYGDVVKRARDRALLLCDRKCCSRVAINSLNLNGGDSVFTYPFDFTYDCTANRTAEKMRFKRYTQQWWREYKDYHDFD